MKSKNKSTHQKITARDLLPLVKELGMTALPIGAQNLLCFWLSFIDNVMISPLGQSATSGVYLGSEISRLLRYFSLGSEGALSTVRSRLLGKGEYERAKKASVFAALFNCTAGLLLALAGFLTPSFLLSPFTKSPELLDTGAAYLKILALSFPLFSLTQIIIASLRCDGKASIGLWSSGIALVANVILNFLLIEKDGGNKGIVGAAWATVISRGIELAVCTLLAVVQRHKSAKTIAHRAESRHAPAPLAYSRGFAHLRGLLDKETALCFFKVALPLIAAQTVWATSMLGGTLVLTNLPRQGVVGATAVASGSYNLALALPSGAVTALCILVARSLGEGNERAKKAYLIIALTAFPVFGALTSATLYLSRGGIISLYGASGSEAELGLKITIPLDEAIKLSVEGDL